MKKSAEFFQKKKTETKSFANGNNILIEKNFFTEYEFKLSRKEISSRKSLLFIKFDDWASTNILTMSINYKKVKVFWS